MSNYPQPPPGGLGSQAQGTGQSQGMGPMYPNPPPAKSGMGTGAIVAIVLVAVVGALVVIIGILAVLGIYGTRKYIANAKTAEARASLGQMSKDAVEAFEREEMGGTTLRLGDATGIQHGRVCPSARSPVPSSLAMVSGKKYQSSSSDWSGDPGWSCLKFELNMPQYYQYNYTSTMTGFTGTANGDLNGDMVPSTFQIQGQVVDGMLKVAPSLMETNPDE